MKPQIFSSYKNIRFGALFFGFWIFLGIFSSNVSAQSSSQNFPTPVTTNEISGTIKARDIGDSRLTSYFYNFNGNQGDIFVNIVTNNFNGDIDIYTLDGSKTLTKVVIYADASDNETGRVIYLRKSEKLLLRVEGRSLNDDPATFKIKFAGSFQAITDGKEVEEPQLPEVKTDNKSGIRVNSVGTIVEIIPKPTPQVKTAEVKTETNKEVVKEITIETEKEKSVVAETNDEKPDKKEEARKIKDEEAETKIAKKAEKTIVEKPKKTKKSAGLKVENNKNTETNVAENKETASSNSEKTAAKRITKTTAKKAKSAKVIEPNLLENIRLIVLFKDGTKLERLMSDVLKVGVDKGILTVISKDGTIGRYSILEVAKMTIE